MLQLQKVLQNSMNRSSDEGGIALLAIALALALLSFVSAASLAINLFMEAIKINNAADRVALAAGTLLVSEPQNACPKANKIATLNNVNLEFCELNDDTLVVKVNSNNKYATWLGRWPKIGMSRAGIDYAFD